MSTYPKVYLYRRFVRAKLFIDNNYHEKIDLADIADEARFSKFHFIRLFKSIFGRTPHQYLIHVRIEKSKALLKTDMNISEICYSIGFESVSSFSGLFKMNVGITPSSYQAKHAEMKIQILRSPLSFIPACFAHENGWIKNSNFQEASY